jgi:DNA gyrase/topoisomerase IV subunit B
MKPLSLNIKKNEPKIVSLNIKPPSSNIQFLNIKPPALLNVQQPQARVQLNLNAGQVDANIYQRYNTTEEHIYNVTDTYIGSDEKMPRSERVLNLEKMCFEEEEITLPEGVERIFIEISSNAGDNVARSLRSGINPGEVTVTMDKHSITVRNGGIPIPIEIHPTEKVWVPHLIFGMLHSSSNYDKTKVRTECGRNGYGAKLTNIFSKLFTVTIGDEHNKRWYRQTWTDNKRSTTDPEIKENYTGKSFVEITYEMDFERFGYTEYPDAAFRLFSRHCADMSFSGKVPVSFNKTKLNLQKSKDYAKLYLGKDGVKNSIVYYQWPEGTPIEIKKGVKYSTQAGVVPVIEICAVDTPDAAINVSFVNGMWTRNGGVHADAAFKAVSTTLLNTINNANNKKKRKKDTKTFKLTIKDVKNHVSTFVSCWIGNPKFDSQSKRALMSPAPKITIDEEILKPIMKWDLMHRLYAELEAKHFKASTKTDGKKKKYLGPIKGEDANHAGTAKSENCTLYITEGNSAMGFATKMLSLYEKGRDYIGLMPLKGKPLNVMNAEAAVINENDEICELKEMLGLCEMTNYLVEDNFKTLRYGSLVILADADTDGKHILGLIINLFYVKYPSLLARGYVKYLRTKIVDVRKGTGKNQKVLKFYSDHEYDLWREKTPDYKSWHHSYFKGLGSSEDEDIAEEFQAPRVVQCFYDDKAPEALQLAFHKKQADARKDWIKNWEPDYSVEQMKLQPISSFINHEFIQFSINDVGRSIPKMMDGMKIGQRKVVWGSMNKWKKSAGTDKAIKIKVGNLASYVSESTNYHHGPASLCDTIVHMVHDFTGSQNMPWFQANGQFGCVDPKTPILLWNGSKTLAENIKVGDELIGDDGHKRTVSHVVEGFDQMYKITQTYGDPYIVNSIHILTLMITEHKKLAWKDSTKSWILTYYDRTSKRVKNKSVRTSECNTTHENHHNKSKISKEDGYNMIMNFRNTIPDDNIIDIPLNEYLLLSQNQKNYMYGFKSINAVQWPKHPYVSSIKVTPVGFGKYCGWHIDGNERFLLGDYTVTHNTRDRLGKDAADPRYTRTRPMWWWKYIIKDDDKPLLKMVEDEGEICEPSTFLPIIPPQLINGVHGIGTGHSTFIPNHDPLDICYWFLSRIDGNPLPVVMPWYRGFTGDIKVVERKPKTSGRQTCPESSSSNGEKPVSPKSPFNILVNKNEKDQPIIVNDPNKPLPLLHLMDDDSDDSDEDPDDVGVTTSTKYTMVTYGKFEVTGNVRKKIIITELPIGRAIHDYSVWLQKMREQKQLTGFISYSKHNTVYFEITGFKLPPTHKNLKLVKRYGISNMVLLDSNNRPVKYDTVNDILESFYALRLPFYQARKDNMLKEIQVKIELLKNKIRFIIAVINGYNQIKQNPNLTIDEAVAMGCVLALGLTKKQIISQMVKLGFDEDLLKKVTLYQCTVEEMNNSNDELQRCIDEFNRIESIPATQMWKDDINDFIKAYCKHYKCKYEPKKSQVELNLNIEPTSSKSPISSSKIATDNVIKLSINTPSAPQLNRVKPTLVPLPTKVPSLNVV